MKLFLSILILCCSGLTLTAQKAVKDGATTLTVTPTPDAHPERPREIVALLNDARLAAPELAVDTFLKVVESKKIKDPEWRREILDEALRMADDVKYPIRKQRVYYASVPVDTVSGYMTLAYDQRLDSLSLKARAIHDILADDRMRARQLVFQIGGDLGLKSVACDEAMSYVVDDLYTSVASVVNEAFTPTEIKEGVRGLFILPWIENIQSPSQIMPVIEMLTDVKATTTERRLLINAFQQSINKNFADDPSFSFAFYRDPNKASRFIADSEYKEELTAAWRQMLVKNTSGPRCLGSKPKKDSLPWPLDAFNWLFPEEKRFKIEDFESVEYRGAPKDKLYTDSIMYKKVSLLYKTARQKKNLPENIDDKAAQLEWQLKVTDTLDLLDSWKASVDESDAEVFNQKTLWYQDLISQVKDPVVELAATRALLRCLASSTVQKDSFIEWLVHVKWAAIHNPTLFKQLADEFPNPNFKVLNNRNSMGL